MRTIATAIQMNMVTAGHVTAVLGPGQLVDAEGRGHVGHVVFKAGGNDLIVPLAAAGIPVELRVWPGQMHVFQLAAPAVSEASRSLKQIGDYIREATW